MNRHTKGRILTAVIATGLVLGVAPSAQAAPYPGDINGDSKVDFADLQAYSAANPTNTTVADIVKNWGTTAPVTVAPPSTPPTSGTFTQNVVSSHVAFASWGDYTPNVANIGYDWGDTAERSVIHIDNVTIPRGSTINLGFLEVTAKAADGAQGGLGARVAAVAGNNIQLPTTAAAVTSAPLTTARSAKWTSTAANWIGMPDAPSIQTVIQEMVNRSDWDSGDDITLVTYNDGSSGNGWFPATGAFVQFTYTAPAAPTNPTNPGPLTATGGVPFGAPWNNALPANPALDPNSAAIVSATLAAGGPSANILDYGESVVTGASSDPVVTVNCTENWGTCDLEGLTNLRIPTTAAVTPGTDGRLIVTQFDLNRVCDFWQASKVDSTHWNTSWGTCAPLNDVDGAGPNGGGTGAGLNALTGTIRTWEISQGVIPHAITGGTSNSCTNTFRYPASKTDGNKSTANCLPEGARLQLDPSINVDAIPNITPAEKAVAKALQTYGYYNRDNAGAFAISFETLEAGQTNVYANAGIPNDYWNMPHIPWNQLRVVAASVTAP